MVSKGQGGRHEAARKSAEGSQGDANSSIAVERYLRGIDFPATKEDLIKCTAERRPRRRDARPRQA